MSEDLVAIGLIEIAFFIVAVASYPAAVLSGCIVGAFIQKQGRKPSRWAFWTNLLPAVTAPAAVGGLAGILWALPQIPDGRFVTAFVGALVAAVLAWGLVYRLVYRVPTRSALVGAVCVPLVAVAVTIVVAFALGTLVATILTLFFN